MTTHTWRPSAFLPLLFIPVGGAIGGFLSYRAAPERSIDPSGQSPVPGILIGVVIGAVVAGIALLIAWRSVRRRAKVLALHPDAVILEAEDVEATGAALARLGDGVAPVGHAYSVAFADDGIHIYHGDDLVPIVMIGWDRVVGIREDFIEVSSKPRSTLVVAVGAEDVVVEVPLVTPASSGLEPPTARVESAASAIAAMRRGAAAPAGADVLPAATRFATPVMRELLPGVRSSLWQAWAKVPPYIGGALAVAVIASRWLSAGELSRGALVPAVAIVAVMTLVSLLLFFLGFRAQKRERAAGYTFSRIGDVEVDQVDPKTGYIIRRAGEPQLTKAREAAELQRVRALG